MLPLQVHIKVPTTSEETHGNFRIVNGTFEKVIKKLLSDSILFSSLLTPRYYEQVFNPESLDSMGRERDLKSPKLHGKYILGLCKSLANTDIIVLRC